MHYNVEGLPSEHWPISPLQHFLQGALSLEKGDQVIRVHQVLGDILFLFCGQKLLLLSQPLLESVCFCLAYVRSSNHLLFFCWGILQMRYHCLYTTCSYTHRWITNVWAWVITLSFETWPLGPIPKSASCWRTPSILLQFRLPQICSDTRLKRWYNRAFICLKMSGVIGSLGFGVYEWGLWLFFLLEGTSAILLAGARASCVRYAVLIDKN